MTILTMFCAIQRAGYYIRLNFVMVIPEEALANLAFGNVITLNPG